MIHCNVLYMSEQAYRMEEMGLDVNPDQWVEAWINPKQISFVMEADQGLYLTFSSSFGVQTDIANDKKYDIFKKIELY